MLLSSFLIMLYQSQVSTHHMYTFRVIEPVKTAHTNWLTLGTNIFFSQSDVMSQ
jgi:hypothetical protein